jgi:transcriptional regulator with XRE-family HTH domain
MTLNQTQVRARELTQRQIDKGRMSVKLLSARTGLKESHCSNWLHGNRGASVGFLSRVLDALEVELEILPKGPAVQRQL